MAKSVSVRVESKWEVREGSAGEIEVRGGRSMGPDWGLGRIGCKTVVGTMMRWAARQRDVREKEKREIEEREMEMKKVETLVRMNDSGSSKCNAGQSTEQGKVGKVGTET